MRRPSGSLQIFVQSIHKYLGARIAGLRDVLIHDYLGLDLDTVWEITQKDVPVLKTNIEDILNP